MRCVKINSDNLINSKLSTVRPFHGMGPHFNWWKNMNCLILGADWFVCEEDLYFLKCS